MPKNAFPDRQYIFVTQPPHGSFPRGGWACSVADLEFALYESVLRLTQDGTPTAFIVSVPDGAEAQLRTRVLNNPAFNSMGKTSRATLPIAYPLLMGAVSPLGLLRAIYESIVWQPAPKVTAAGLFDQVHQMLRSNGTLCLMIGNCQDALAGQDIENRQRNFEVLAKLTMPKDGTRPLNLLLTGTPKLTRNLPREARLLPRRRVMHIAGGR